jgi:hypothetical protein
LKGSATKIAGCSAAGQFRPKYRLVQRLMTTQDERVGFSVYIPHIAT